MLRDRHGNAVTGATVEAVEAFDSAVHAFNIYRGDPVALVDEAIASAPGFAMAYIMKGYLFGLATEPEATSAARGLASQAEALVRTDREVSHLAALRHLLAGDWTRAALVLDRHTIDHPHDILAIQAGHLVDFYRANARNLRDRIARVLPRWSQSQPGYAVLLGMHAFGLEETGDYARAEAAGREAVAREPLDCWAHHAVAHVMEMQGRAEDGIGWMAAREPHWAGDDNFFKVHNWWHTALYHLDLGNHETVMSLYDSRVRAEPSAVALELVDAAALLWRVHLDGHDVGARWNEVAETWDRHADGELYPFNDWHAAMAWLGAGRIADVDRLISRYRSAGERRSEAGRWAIATGLPLIEGFKAFWLGDYEVAVERLHGARFIANTFGGSHAQRDVIDWTLTEAAARSCNAAFAEALANERLSVKPHSPVNRRFLMRARTPEPQPNIAA